MSERPQPFAYIASREGRWHGVIAARLPATEIKKFYADFAGCDISITFTRDEYNAKMKVLEP